MIIVKVDKILNDMDRNIRWLANKADINYSTLYNFTYNKTNSVNYDIIDKLCCFLNCNIQDVIEYVPEETNNIKEPN